MDMVQIKITGMVITHRYGTLSAGDVLRTDASFAKHLIEDCAAAEYIATPAPAQAEAQPTKAKKK